MTSLDETLVPVDEQPPGETDEQIVSRYMRGFEADLKAHQVFAREVDRRYRAYRGVLEKRSQANDWHNKYHPAYVLQSVETMVASLIDPAPKWRLRAKPRMASLAERERLTAGALANQLLLNDQLANDHFAEKQRVIDLQALITGLTVTKQRWNYVRQPVRQHSYHHMPVYDQYGNVTGNAPIAVAGSIDEVVHDDPTCEAVDVRDWVWHEGAVSLEKCARVTHRCWYTFDELKELECRVGDYHHPDECDGMYHHVDELRESRDFAANLYDREQDLFQVSRAKGQIEVLEMWCDHGRRLVAVGNRKVLLRNVENPYWFDRLSHRYPFTVCSSMPDLFRIPGISEVELMQELQEMLWSLSNQRLDATQLLASPIFMVRDDIDDDEVGDLYPGAVWRMPPGDINNAWTQWSPDVRVAQVSLEAEGLIKGDLQNITGGMPMLSGTDTQTVDQQTATGVSIVTTLAQRRLAAKKQQFTWAKRRIGEQWCAMNQQFVTAERVVAVTGREGGAAFETIRPEMLQGHYVFETEMVEESLMRQERRAEAQSLVQVFFGVILPGMIPLVQSGLAPMPNAKKIVDDFYDKFDIADKEAYWTDKPPPMAQQGQPGAPQQASPAQIGPGEAAVLGQPGTGVTASQATDANSPSNGASQSPAVFQQRYGAASGGAANG